MKSGSRRPAQTGASASQRQSQLKPLYNRYFQDNAKTYFPAEQPPSRQNARFSDPHEDRRRPGRHLPPARRRPQEADRQLGEVARIPGFPKSVRLLRSGDFRKVYDQGTRYTCPLLRRLQPRRACTAPRIGFTTPRALGKAVVRNRIKRRVREAVRLELALLSPEWSIVFNPRRKALDCLFTELQAEVRRFFLRSPRPSPSSSSPGTNV